MELKKMQIKMLSCCFLAGGLTLAGCSTDDSIDVGEVDTTIGVKLNNFTVPLGQAEKITLGDVLDLKDDDCISTTANGDYEFFKQGDAADPAHPQVDIINVSEKTSKDEDPFIGPSEKPAGFDLLPVGTTLTGTAGSISKALNTFNYSAAKPDDVLDLTTAEVEGEATIIVNFNTHLQGFIDKFTSFDIEFPAYMTLEEPTQGTLVGNKLRFGEVATNSTIYSKVKLKSLKFQEIDAANKLVIQNGNITMLGDVKVDVTYPDLVKKNSSSDITKMQINGITSITTVKITSATGKFDPKIDLDDIGDIKINSKDVPDFLDDPQVNITLTDPQITLNINSDVDLDAVVDGTLTSTFNNGTTSEVKISNIEIPRKKNSKILICRQPKNEPYQDYTKVYVVENLSDLMTKIPEKVTFKANARVDKTKAGTIKLGTPYTISTSYSFKAPLSLEAGSTIVYDDKTDGFYEDIDENDIDLRGEAELVITGKVTNNSPLELTLDPTAIDVDGNALKGIKLVSANTIKSNLTDKTPSDLKITLTKDANVNLKDVKFDGIKFKATAVSKDATTLNKDNHYININDLKISVNSEISIDADKKKDDKK
ncbi:hypothetical protein [Prevotella communis]|uniref:hypothetical protein n=1 Tax=Prevotella communis TaxID=2913614 RepID=UPI001EDC0784|nr:hypothetical protein [Prevotella communis]UKK56453.1 hypothetical protein L6476_13530 [Prevotella communis]UKK61981.1 hypothetical protein L6468_13530 [Prevotella communis]UKK64808.1 hypothetical protein L6473_13540 [Prevotella communis]